MARRLPHAVRVGRLHITMACDWRCATPPGYEPWSQPVAFARRETRRRRPDPCVSPVWRLWHTTEFVLPVDRVCVLHRRVDAWGDLRGAGWRLRTEGAERRGSRRQQSR